MKGVNLNYKFLYLSLIFAAGCGTSFKLIYKGNNARAYDRITQTSCELLWTSFKEDGIIEDVYGPPCNTIVKYRDK